MTPRATLGRGAFAHTLLARDVALGRQVALKVLHPRVASDAKACQPFEREAAVLKELHHPGIPVIHLAFKAEWDGVEAAFLAMEYIEGTSLAHMIAFALFIELLGVLDYLHSRVPPVLHRGGSDRVLPGLGVRWSAGTEVRVLYLPDADYDSVIIGSA